MSKLEWLHAQAEAYWREAEAAPTEEQARRLIELAIRCQEQILELQYGAPESDADLTMLGETGFRAQP